jgi:N-acetyl-gamma-glutamyl-phosphate reductase
MATRTRIGILGASGYTGAELLRILLGHPRADVALLTADRKANREMREIYPQFSPYSLPSLVTIDSIDWMAAGVDFVFCALPHATTQTVIKRVLGEAPAIRVVDLSADFRLSV